MQACDSTKSLDACPRCVPPLDPDFRPAALWLRAYRALQTERGAEPLAVALERESGTCDVYTTALLPHREPWAALNERHVERLVKFLLWQRGATRITLAGDAAPALTRMLRQAYSSDGARAFDAMFFSHHVYREPLTVRHCAPEALPEPRAQAMALGRHLDGCRIGFDLGGSDRKCAAVVDGRVVFSDETAWSPYFEADPTYHREGIRDSLRRAAAHLPRVDAIGGSAAGLYVNNEIRAGSLYRGVSPEEFERHIRRLFLDLRAEWNGVPFEVVNDGEVTALAGSMFMRLNGVLGLAMGTSTAAGCVTADGGITPWLNELAFVPVDYRADAPADEWSGDCGCGVQYFSQQAVGRLLDPAGIEAPADMPLPEKLVRVQARMAAGDARARRIYETIGVYLGYALAHFAEFYTLDNVLLLGRVASGDGGAVILEQAAAVLRTEFPDVADRVCLHTPDETMKRHGQAIAAASLPRPAAETGP
jgi:predicted NBD/HSP70 family sugar kinase